MEEYEYTVEIYAVKTLRIRADSGEKADEQADLIITTETIPVTQDDIVDISVKSAYKVNDETNEDYHNFLF